MTHALGIGASSGVPAGELAVLVDEVLSSAGLGAGDVTDVGTSAARAAEAGMQELCEARGWTLTGFDAQQLAGVAVPHPSEVVAAAVGTASVAEAAALLLGSELVVPKTSAGRVTVALAGPVNGAPP